MGFLTWNNETDANDSIAAVNAAYGCPYVLENGYRMDQWALSTKSDAENKWGFSEPEVRPGKAMGLLNAALKGGNSRSDKRPDNWIAGENKGV